MRMGTIDKENHDWLQIWDLGNFLVTDYKISGEIFYHLKVDSESGTDS